MGTILRLTAFYQTEEFNAQDIEKELFTEDKEEFHLFFFHNKSLHFSRKIIKRDTLRSVFKDISPRYSIKKKDLYMIKKIKDFNREKFEGKVDAEYKKYLNNINYRIECIFQTLIVFLDLYKDRTLIYILPEQLYDRFMDLLHKKELSFDNLEMKNKNVRKYDIVYWANYFSRINPESPQEGIIKKGNITRIIEIKKTIQEKK